MVISFIFHYFEHVKDDFLSDCDEWVVIALVRYGPTYIFHVLCNVNASKSEDKCTAIII